MTKQRSRRRPAVSAIFGMILGIGITAAIAGTLIFVVQDQIGISTSGSSIQVSNLSVQRDGDELSLTGTVKNTGSTSISEIIIDSIRVSDLTIEQIRALGDDDNTTDGTVPIIHVVGTNTGQLVNEYFCVGPLTGFNVATSGSAVDKNCSEVEDYKGFSLAMSETVATGSVLEGGRTNAFKLVIESNNSTGITKNVRISDNLSLILEFRSGDDTLLSETYQARVRSG